MPSSSWMTRWVINMIHTTYLNAASSTILTRISWITSINNWRNLASVTGKPTRTCTMETVIFQFWIVYDLLSYTTFWSILTWIRITWSKFTMRTRVSITALALIRESFQNTFVCIFTYFFCWFVSSSNQFTFFWVNSSILSAWLRWTWCYFTSVTSEPIGTIAIKSIIIEIAYSMILTWIRFTWIILTRLTKISIKTIAVKCAMKYFTISFIIAWITSTRCYFTCFTTITFGTFTLESITIMPTYSMYTWVTGTRCIFTIDTKITRWTIAFVCVALKSTCASILTWLCTAWCDITYKTTLKDSHKLSIMTHNLW